MTRNDGPDAWPPRQMLLHVESVADRTATKILAKHLQSEKQDLKQRRIRDPGTMLWVILYLIDITVIVSYIDISMYNYPLVI